MWSQLLTLHEKPQIVEIHMLLNVPIRTVAHVKVGAARGYGHTSRELAVYAMETAVFNA